MLTGFTKLGLQYISIMELVLQAVSVRRGLQAQQVSYIASMLLGDIVRLIDDDRLYVPNDPEQPDLAQRKLNPTRVKAIAKYILTTYRDGTTFFPPICINVQPPPTYKDGYLFLPYHSTTLRLTDGQHRCFGIHKAFQELQLQQPQNVRFLAQLEIGVLLYAGLSLEEERQAFRDQNLLVQRPSVSLSYYFDQKSPAVFIAKALIERVSHFNENVETIENSLGRHNPKLMTLSTLVRATQAMFPKIEPEDDIELKVDWAEAFWKASANALPNNPWRQMAKEERSQQRQNSIAVSAVVIQALGFLARDLYQESIPASELGQWFIRLKDIDWRRENRFWLERGVTQIGENREAITTNTKTTVKACHKVLREFIGVAPVSGVVG
jgi:DNA sulfur modification protein DndB